MFYKHVGVEDSNEAEALADLEALRIHSHVFSNSSIVESDSSNSSIVESDSFDSFNALSWVTFKRFPWKFHFYFNEIKSLSSSSRVSFQHVNRSTEGMAGRCVS